MFKYLWMVLVGIPWIIWAIVSIRDFYNCIKNDGLDGLNDVDETSASWLIVTFLALFVMSFVAWLISIKGE